MLRREDFPTLKKQGVVEHIPFNQERSNFSKLNAATIEATKTIQSFTSGTFGAGEQEFLSSPGKKRDELQKMKEAVQSF